MKATVRQEVAEGQRLSGTDVANAYGHLNVLWRRSVEFFSQFDLLAAPVTQCAPFPIEWEYPTEVAGVASPRYTDWMRSACRVTVMGTPALSLPAGFDSAGLPVGLQLVARQFADIELLSMAKTLEIALAS